MRRAQSASCGRALRILVRRAWRRLQTPAYRWLRIPLGVVMIVGGLLGFLPVLGFWMIPLGVALLGVDLPLLRRPLRWFRIGRGGPGGRASDLHRPDRPHDQNR